MSKFKQVVYHQNTSTVDIGSGLTWDEVYAQLEPYNVTVVGARATGVGVAGLLLGGGKPFHSIISLVETQNHSLTFARVNRLLLQDQPVRACS